jgi:hypothetical protein
VLGKPDKKCCYSHSGTLHVNVLVLVNVNAHENVRFFALGVLSRTFT